MATWNIITHHSEEPTTNGAFFYWATDTTATADGSTYARDATWSNWTTTTTTSPTAEDGTWNFWVSGEDASDLRARWITPSKIAAPAPKSTEQKRAFNAQRQINKKWRDIRIAEEEQHRRDIELTAQRLLEDLISPEQSEVYKKTGRLVVKGRQFDYVIEKDRGVYQVDKDKVIDLCIHLREKYKFPETDNVIGLKLLIEGNEREFLRTANSNGLVRQETKDRILELVAQRG